MGATNFTGLSILVRFFVIDWIAFVLISLLDHSQTCKKKEHNYGTLKESQNPKQVDDYG